MAVNKIDYLNKSNKLDDFLSQIVFIVKSEFKCQAFYEYHSFDKNSNDEALKFQLTLILIEMGLNFSDLEGKNIFLCTNAVEIDEYDDVVSSNRIVKSDWDVEFYLEGILDEKITSVGLINKGDKKYRKLNFLMKL